MDGASMNDTFVDELAVFLAERDIPFDATDRRVCAFHISSTSVLSVLPQPSPNPSAARSVQQVRMMMTMMKTRTQMRRMSTSMPMCSHMITLGIHILLLPQPN